MKRHKARPERQDVDGQWYCWCGRYYRLALMTYRVGPGRLRTERRPSRAAHGEVVPEEKRKR